MHVLLSIMKHAALSILLSLVFISPAFAILRPRFPVKPMPPYRGHFLILGQDADNPWPGAPSPAPR
jgi:hypothetical protein